MTNRTETDHFSPPDTGSGRGRKIVNWAVIASLFSVVGGAIGLVLKWDDSPTLQRRLCVEYSAVREWVQKTNQCAPEFTEISPANARVVIDTYLASLGARPDHGWNMLSEAGRARLGPEQAYAERYETTLMAERLDGADESSDRTAGADLTRTDFNVYAFSYRIYRARAADGQRNVNSPIGSVDDYRTTVWLGRGPDGRISLFDLQNGGKLPSNGNRQRFARATFTDNTKTFRWPDSDRVVFSDVRPNRSLRVLCEYSVDGRLWYRSYGGWFSADVVTLDQQPVGGVLTCQKPEPVSP